MLAHARAIGKRARPLSLQWPAETHLARAARTRTRERERERKRRRRRAGRVAKETRFPVAVAFLEHDDDVSLTRAYFRGEKEKKTSPPLTR